MCFALAAMRVVVSVQTPDPTFDNKSNKSNHTAGGSTACQLLHFAFEERVGKYTHCDVVDPSLEPFWSPS